MIHLLVLSMLCMVAHSQLGRHAQIIGRDTTLQAEYDFVIIGGGTSGLTVADRLTEDADVSVLVLEFGPLDSEEANVVVPGLSANAYAPYSFNLTSTPQKGLANNTFPVLAAAVVGGGTVVNGMFFDRGGAPDYDAWEQLGNPGWGWDGLLPYFRKSETFTPTNESFAEEWDVSWDLSVHGSSGPVQSRYPPFMWQNIKNFFRAWTSLGVPIPSDPGAGSKAGVFWGPSSVDPRNQSRCSARVAHYDRVSLRPNYHLATMHAVTKILFNGSTAIGAEFITNGQTGTVQAAKEVVLAAGAAHTPQILQLSGIGPTDLLSSLGIDVLVDLPTGYNLQDHPTFYSAFSFANPSLPNAETLVSNETYASEQLALYYSSREGPYTLGRGQTVCFLPLQNITDSDTFTAITSLARSTNASSAYSSRNIPAIVKKGYVIQKNIISDLYSSLDTSVKESSFGGAGTMAIVMVKPLSRGTVLASSTDPLAKPVIDYGTMTAPSDIKIMMASVRKVREFMATPAMSELQPTELVPGANLTTDAQLEPVLRGAMQPTFAHVCCTAPMMAREDGGVLDPELRVYGVERLRVVDASLMPLLPATHTSSTIYAIAEKAADLIKQSHS